MNKLMNAKDARWLVDTAAIQNALDHIASGIEKAARSELACAVFMFHDYLSDPVMDALTQQEYTVDQADVGQFVQITVSW